MAAALVVIVLAGVKAASAHHAIARPVSRFIHFYEVTENPGTPMATWKRVMLSLMLTGRDSEKSKT